MTIIYSLKNVVKSRLVDGAGFRLNIPSVEIHEKEHIALVGHSGCGKSTLLDMLALALHPDSADDFTLSPQDEEPLDIDQLWQKKKQNVLSRLRKEHIGYVLQQGGLLPYLTVREKHRITAQTSGSARG